MEFVVVGPELPLVEGLVDDLQATGIPIFGPSRLAAELEASKIYAMTRCKRWGIDTPEFDFAGSMKVAEKILENPLFRVIKADGLAAGKGVYVSDTEAEALKHAHLLLVAKKHGAAGEKILIQERLSGVEISVMALSDGENVVMLPTARDNKAAYDGNKGPNTGGMGAISPSPDSTDDLLAEIQENILMRAVRGMAKEGRPFHGILYAGIILTEGNSGVTPKLIEFNVRLGDPEVQAILPRIKSDIVPYLLASTKPGGLRDMPALEVLDQKSVAVVITDNDYPYSGKRLKTVVGLGTTWSEARAAAYSQVLEQGLNGTRYRNDIAAGL